MKKYIYRGPDSGATLNLPDGSSMDVMLWNGREVELPADHDYTKALLGQRLIEEVKTETKKGGK